MKNSIEDLRNHLFETIEGLKDPEHPMDIARAKAIAEVAKTVIDTARVEVDYIKATDQIPSSQFIRLPAAPEAQRTQGRLPAR